MRTAAAQLPAGSLLLQKPYWWPDAKDWNEALQRHDVMFNEVLTQLTQERLKALAPDPEQAMRLFAVVHGRMQRLWQMRETSAP